MIFVAVLAGGSGVRMGNPDKPKQFFTLGEKPVLIHTVDKFLVQSEFEKVIVLCPESWLEQTKDMLKKYSPHFLDRIVIIAGGHVRNETIMNAITYIEKHYEVDEDTILVTHDAVRPFVSHRIINDNIDAAESFGACDTVISSTDTIVESIDGETISNIPDRSLYYQGQTPQSFKMLRFKKLYSALSEEQKAILTDACKVFTYSGEQVALVKGDASNIKLTYPHDMRLAKAMLED